MEEIRKIIRLLVQEELKNKKDELLTEPDEPEGREEAEARERAPEPSAPPETSTVIEQNLSEAVNDAFRIEDDNFDLPPTYEEVFEIR